MNRIIITKYDSDSEKCIASIYINNKNDTLFDGIVKYYYKNGSIREKDSFVNNLREGWCLFFNNNSKLDHKVYLKRIYPIA